MKKLPPMPVAVIVGMLGSIVGVMGTGGRGTGTGDAGVRGRAPGGPSGERGRLPPGPPPAAERGRGFALPGAMATMGVRVVKEGEPGDRAPPGPGDAGTMSVIVFTWDRLGVALAWLAREDGRSPVPSRVWNQCPLRLVRPLLALVGAPLVLPMLPSAGVIDREA